MIRRAFNLASQYVTVAPFSRRAAAALLYEREARVVPARRKQNINWS